MFSLAFGFFNWFSFQLVSLSLWTFFLGSSWYLGWAHLMLIFKIDIFYGSTISLVQVLWFDLVLCTLALVECSRWFWGSGDSIFVHYFKWCMNIGELLHFYLEHSFAQIIKLCVLFGLLDLLDCLSPFGEMFRDISFICNLWSS